MIQVVLIDDERKGRLTLKKLLEMHAPDFEIAGQADSVSTGVELIRKTNPDAVFLDIEMADGSGFDLLKNFDNPFFHFVFVTAHSNYAVKAFRYSAVDYIMKPVDPEDLLHAVDKIREAVQNGVILKLHKRKEGQTLRLKMKGEFVDVSGNRVISLEAQGSYTEITLDEGDKYLVSYNLKSLTEKINDTAFIRIHRSRTINVNFINPLRKGKVISIELADGRQFEIARRNRTQLFKIIDMLGKSDRL